MRTEKPDINLEHEADADSHCSVPCFECETGHYKTELRPYSLYALFESDPAAKIRNVPHEVCDQCGDICFSPEGIKLIDYLKLNIKRVDSDQEGQK